MTIDKAEKRVRVKCWHITMALAEADFKAVSEAVGLHPEGPLNVLVGLLQNALTNEVGFLLDDGVDDGDCVGWLRWHWTENRLGARGLTAIVNGESRSITTVDDLIWAMVLEGE